MCWHLISVVMAKPPDRIIVITEMWQLSACLIWSEMPWVWPLRSGMHRCTALSDTTSVHLLPRGVLSSGQIYFNQLL